MSARTCGPVLVIGTGLLGASVGMGLRRLGVSVELEDASPTAQALARDMGAGTIRADRSEDPRFVVVATPPDVTSTVVASALERFPAAVVTDVASVKSIIAAELVEAGVECSRYVGSHPMAGRERSGAGWADADLFYQRPWVIAPMEESGEEARDVVLGLALDLGAVPLEFRAEDHDAAVARVSHVPQLVASLLAARLLDTPAEALRLAGQGLRDTTRIARSDPRLWAAIVGGNSLEIAAVLREFSDDLLALLHALDSAHGDPLAPGTMGEVTRVLEAGNDGVGRIPGKHGGAPRRYAEISILIPDKPGHLGRLFTDLGQAGINIEDFTMEHSAGAPQGVGRVFVEPGAAEIARRSLTRLGWSVLEGAR